MTDFNHKEASEQIARIDEIITYVVDLKADIESLQAKLDIAVDALGQVKESVSEDWSQTYATEALNKIRKES